MDGGAHEGEALVANAIATRMWQLVDEAVGSQELQQTSDTTALAAALLRVLGVTQFEMTGDVAGIKPALDVLAAQDCEEQLLILGAERIERAATLAFIRDRSAGAVQDTRADSRVLDHGQRLQVTVRGLA